MILLVRLGFSQVPHFKDLFSWLREMCSNGPKFFVQIQGNKQFSVLQFWYCLCIPITSTDTNKQ